MEARRVALLLAAACAAFGCAREKRRPSILLVTLDTTRADHLSCYGYAKPTSPNVDRLAADSIRYVNAYATSSWTLPTHASLFTGKLPTAHGATFDPEGPLHLTQEGGIKGNASWDAYRARPLARDELTLAELLRRDGFATGAVVAGPWLKRVFSLARGFDAYDDGHFVDLGAKVGELNGRPAEDVTRAAIEYVDTHADRPFFLFLNYYDPHSPWLPPEPHKSAFWSGPEPQRPSPDYASALYDAEIQYADLHLGRLLDHLKARGLYDDCWIVVTADHGELLGDEGLWGHGDSLFQSEIHIPLLVKEPGVDHPRGVSDAFVQQIDLLPTLLQRLSIPIPRGIQGTPIADLPGHPIVAEVNPLPFMSATKKDARQIGGWRALIAANDKLVWSELGHHALYDLVKDPGETTNRYAVEPERARQLQQILAAYVATLPAPGEVGPVEQPDEETRRLLESLGYTERGESGSADRRDGAR